MTALTHITIFHGFEVRDTSGYADSEPFVASLPFPYGDGGALSNTDGYVRAYSYIEADPERQTLDGIYRWNNAVTGDEYNVEHESRSLSVGDVIRTGPRSYWLVESVGFTELTTKQIRKLRRTLFLSTPSTETLAELAKLREVTS